MELSKRIERNCGKLIIDCTDYELFEGLVKTVNDLKPNMKNDENIKKVYYISAEFLVGRLLETNLINLGIYEDVRRILGENGKNLTDVAEIEIEPSLGNGGLGRLASCLLDSAAYTGLACDGIGLLYHFGLFRQFFKNNRQYEEINPWIDENKYLTKTDVSYKIKCGNGVLKSRLYTIDIIGRERVNKLNLFDLETVDEKIADNVSGFDKNATDKNLTLFLYPDDSDESGRRLRICQEYFMAVNAARLITEECFLRGAIPETIADYAVIQINDTHPSFIIPALIDILTERGLGTDKAVNTVRNMCAYTNHTILAEALEKWDMETIEEISPRIADIIRELDGKIKSEYHKKNLHIIDDDLLVHMARMDIHCGFSVNGVAPLHTEILKENELRDFYEIYPYKFNNKTNGISMRRWLSAANPRLYKFIKSLIGNGFERDYSRLKEIEKYRADGNVLKTLLDIKNRNKSELSEYVKEQIGVSINPESVFDVQIKRMHEYKRQQMNVLYLISKYLDIKRGAIPKRPITAIFGAKAAPAYTVAKDIIHLILCMAQITEAEDSDFIKIFIAENYNVTWAEKIIPAADISEQISLASKEASGTGNMKLMLNGAVTLGTADGANVEINALVGDGNMYTFGLDSREVADIYENDGYSPRKYYEQNRKLKEAVDFITGPEMLEVGDKESLFRLREELINKDRFMTFVDFEDYCEIKDRMFGDYEDRIGWAEKMLINIAESGYFSSDRTVREYNAEIWHL